MGSALDVIMFDFAEDTAADIALIIKFKKISLGPVTRIGPGLLAMQGRPFETDPSSLFKIRPFDHPTFNLI